MTKALEVLHDDRYLERVDGLTLKDTITNRVGEFENITALADDLFVVDSADTVAIALPCVITKRNEVYPDIPEKYYMGVGVLFETNQTLDRVVWNSRGTKNISFFTTELEKIPTLWDTVVPMLNEWNEVLKNADKDNTVDFNRIIKLQNENKKLQALKTATEYYNLLATKLPIAKRMQKAMPVDQEANLITKEIVQMDNVLPEMKERIYSSNVYSGISDENEIVRKAEYLKQYYTDMRTFLILSKQRENNHNRIMEYMKPAKYIVKIYNEYYNTTTCEWNDENSSLPHLKNLVEKQDKLLPILNRADLDDFIKRAKKSKCKTIDDILGM